MALGQALLTKPPKPKTAPQQQQAHETPKTDKTALFQEQSLKFEQSLELVQTLLGASIGCLSFLRGLLPEECFIEKRYGGKSSAAISYRSFTSDLEDESFKKTQSSSGTRVKRLRRGYSGEADQLLDWLEIGIFDALKMGYLKAVQLAIYVDKEHPDIIVESYTFSFAYRDQEDGNSTISLRVTDITGRGVTVEDANKNLQLMMRRLIVITQNLSPLPDQRWLTIRLHYLDHTPSNYDPPSFVRVSDKSPVLKFHENEAKEVEKLDVGDLNAGFHAVSLKISSMNDTDNQERPRRRRGSRFIHADVDIEAPQLTTDTFQKFARTHTNGTTEPFSKPTTSERTEPQKFTRPVHNRLMLRNPTIDGGGSAADRATEFTGRDIQEKMVLRDMLRQVTRENDVIATQPLSFSRPTTDSSQLASSMAESPLIPIPGSQTLGASHRPTTVSGSLSTPELMPIQTKLFQQQAPVSSMKQAPPGKVSNTHIPKNQSPRNKNVGNQEVYIAPQDSLTQDENAIESVDKNMAKLKLSKAKTTELKKANRNGNRKDRAMDESTRHQKGSKHHINCECGDEKSEEDMICCDNCDEWQHTDCYGFASAKDIRIPDYHVCYSCLLGSNEGKLLEEMRNMALFRKALRIIWKQGSFPSSNKVFANKLGCDLPTALQITRRLENEGFIANDAAKAKIHRKRVYKVVKTEETKQLMDTEYFDPLKKISHHFENPTAPNIIRESLLKESLLLARPPSDTFPVSLTNTAIEDSQLGGITHVNEDLTLDSQLKFSAHTTNADAESTADEEDSSLSQKAVRHNIVSHGPAAVDHFRNLNRLNNTSHIYNDARMTHKPLFEIAESPEPMEIDIIEESQVARNLLTQVFGEATSRRCINVGGVLQDIFVGEELGDRRF